MKRAPSGGPHRSSHSRRLPAYLLVALPVIVFAVLLARGRVPVDTPHTQPTPTATIAQAATQRATPTALHIPPPTATAAVMPLPTLDATATPSPTSTAIPSPTVTIAPSPTATSTRAPTATAVPAPPTATAAATHTPRPPTPSATALPATATTAPDKGQRTVAVDPGHGGVYAGAVHYNSSGAADVVEKDVNLRVGLLLADMLHEAGYRVVMTRATDTIVNTSERDQNGDGKVTVEDDLQARVDLINAGGADLLLSIHHNGSESPMRGTTTYYCASRPFADRNRALAAAAHAGILARLREAGYASPVDLGVRDDGTLGKPGGHLCLVGPTTEYLARASEMPGLVGEALFVSDNQEAAMLKDDRFLRAIAAGYRDGVLSYFADHP